MHAVRGERRHYRPVQSVLTDAPTPLAVARALRERFGFSELYVADLDAIEGGPGHEEVLRRLIESYGLRLLVDAGVADVGRAQRLLEIGVHRVVVASETLTDSGDLAAIGAVLPPERRVFSLDLREGRVLSKAARLAGRSAVEALGVVRTMGWLDVIILDLARVGTGMGPDAVLIREIRQWSPDVALLVGGGIRSVEDLERLRALGVEGVLVATALHAGALSPKDLREWIEGGERTAER